MMLSWERILEIARDPTSSPSSPRSPEVARRYAERGCTLDLDFQSEWLFVPNDYPYNTTDDVSHYVLFRRRDLSMVCPREYLDAAIPALFQAPVEYVWFENPCGMRSIVAVGHYHVFVRDTTEPSTTPQPSRRIKG